MYESRCVKSVCKIERVVPCKCSVISSAPGSVHTGEK